MKSQKHILRKTLVTAAILICAWSSHASQIDVTLRINHEKALRFEPVIATVTIVNRSGRLLSFGGTNTSAALDFFITRDNGVLIRKKETGFIPATHVLPGERKTIALDIAYLYNFDKDTDYRIQAILRTEAGPFSSGSVRLILSKGFELARISTGVPGTRDVSTFTLEFLKRDAAEELYLRVKDEQAGLIYGVFNLGKFVRARPPSLVCDEAGNAHILFDSLNSCIHTAFTPYGIQLFAEQYPRAGQNINLRQSNDGSIRVFREEIDPAISILK